MKRSYADPLSLDVKASDNIETVKAKIQGKTGITVDKLRLFFAGQQLKAEGTLLGYNTLADYNIKAQNTIEMMDDREKVKGGAGARTSGIKLKPKVAKVKTVLTTTAVQVPVLEQATTVAVQFAGVTTAAADEVLADMTTESLLACKAFMNEDRTHIEKKLEKICEYTTQWQKLEAARLLIVESQARCSHIVKEAVANKFDTVGEFSVSIDKAVAAKLNATPQGDAPPGDARMQG